jgi:hypothetical protein
MLWFRSYHWQSGDNAKVGVISELATILARHSSRAKESWGMRVEG